MSEPNGTDARPGASAGAHAARGLAHGGDRAVADECHPDCIACRDRSKGGLGLKFHLDASGGVVGSFRCEPEYQGYPDRLHGGIIAMALDAAMTHCLFYRRAQAVTAKLEVRFRRRVRLREDLVVCAQLVACRGAVYKLRAEARQGATVCAEATAIFMDLESNGRFSPERDR